MPARRSKGFTPNTQAGLEDINSLSLGEVRSRLERNARVLNTSLFSSSPTSPSMLSSSPSNGFHFSSSGMAAGGGAGSFSAAVPQAGLAGQGQALGATPSPAVLHASASTPAPSASATGGVDIPNALASPRNLASPGEAPDPVRDKLLAVRRALLDRERQLLAEANGEGPDNASANASASASASGSGSGSGSGTMEVDGQGGGVLSPPGRRPSDGLRAGASTARSGKARALESIQAEEKSLAPGSMIL